MSLQDETIAAIATPAGNGGVGVIRISGSQSAALLYALTDKTLQDRELRFTAFFDQNKTIIDQGLALYFKGPASFTGEDVVEIQAHGGHIVMHQLLDEVLKLGARHANPGEFSERAFLNGKMDLVQAEAIADLINSTSDAAARSAMRSLQGQFSDQITQVREKIIHLRTYIEALLDFSDEEIDVDTNRFVKDAETISQQLEMIQKQAQQGARLHEGVRVCILGKPNAGKSSLMNQLLQDNRAIVTDVAGTTRDTLTESFFIDGCPFVITDTAGIRETADQVEQEGIKRAEQSAAAADLVLELIDATDEEKQFPLERSLQGIQCEVITVFNKIDRLNADQKNQVIEKNPSKKNVILLSAKTGEGLEFLKQTLLKKAGMENRSEGIFSARKRHLDALLITQDEVLNALPALANSAEFDLAAESLRLAQESLNKITGEFTTEDLLGEIFSGFCIGK